MKNRLLGIGLTLILSITVILVFFGSSIRNLNNTFFSTGGDGFKAYYGALYHIQYDSVDYKNGSMNYPFGELSVFTDSQPPVTNAVRFICRNIVDISGNTTGIINGLMLLSIILGAVFIFLIFNELHVGWLYGALAATGITILSPQIARLGGHFSLSWQVWIPAMVYFLIRFDKTRKFTYTLLIAAFVFLAGKMHPYFLGFYGFLIVGYWVWRFIRYRSADTIWYRDVLNVFIQFVLPVILVEMAIMLHDDVFDRTVYPYGFKVFLSHPAAVFLPAGKPWLFVPRIFTVFDHLSWESWAYIGTSALAGILVSVLLFWKKHARKQPLGKLSGSDPLNTLFWVSVAALIFSFGIPFIFTGDWLIDLLGPVRQLRALGRFAWLFYYLVNIMVFTALYFRAFKGGKSTGWKIVAVAALVMLFYEGYWNMQTNTTNLNNRFPEMEDHENITAANKWTENFNPRDYQAIIPLPYFHIGSENIWIDGTDEAKLTAMLVSLKTGLPTTGVELSRTSISQTYINYSMFTEPLQRLEMVDYLENEKPFLVLLMNGYEPSEPEKWLLKDAFPVLTTEKFALMSLPVSHIANLHETWQQNILQKFDKSRLVPKDGFMVSDAALFFRNISFDQQSSAVSLHGGGAFTFPARQWKQICEDTLNALPQGKQMLAGFWIYHYRKDGYLRANLEVVQKNKTTGETTGFIYSDFFRHLKAFQDDWALVEFDFETKSDDEVIQVRVNNSVLSQAEYVIDEFLIREKDLDVWKQEGETLLLNGRKYRAN